MVSYQTAVSLARAFGGEKPGTGTAEISALMKSRAGCLD